MPLLRRQIADYPTDERPAPTRTEWINPDQIETAAAHVTWTALDPVLWLEVTMTSGAVHYLLVGPVPPLEVDAATDAAMAGLERCS